MSAVIREQHLHLPLSFVVQQPETQRGRESVNSNYRAALQIKIIGGKEGGAAGLYLKVMQIVLLFDGSNDLGQINTSQLSPRAKAETCWRVGLSDVFPQHITDDE